MTQKGCEQDEVVEQIETSLLENLVVYVEYDKVDRPFIRIGYSWPAKLETHYLSAEYAGNRSLSNIYVAFRHSLSSFSSSLFATSSAS